MASSPDLFVVCKSCGSQVSPYVTECPYCSARLRKRAPKIERPRSESPKRGRRGTGGGASAAPRLGPLRSGEIPGIRGDAATRPYVTIALVALGCLSWLALVPLRDGGVGLIVAPLRQPWQVLTAPLFNSGVFAFVALGTVGLFGWLLERRHGPLVTLAVWLLAASGGMAVVRAVEGGDAFALGASGGAVALLLAWGVPHLRARRAGEEDEGDADLIGAGVLLVLNTAMPLARVDVDPLATLVGLVVGVLAGLALAARRR